MENTSDAKFYVEMVYNVSWSRLVWMIIACVAGDKRRKARPNLGTQEGEESAARGKRTPCAPIALSCAEILHFLVLLNPARETMMMITQVVERN